VVEAGDAVAAVGVDATAGEDAGDAAAVRAVGTEVVVAVSLPAGAPPPHAKVAATATSPGASHHLMPGSWREWAAR